ncbi:MAG: hypothetical protein GY847_35040 [Proteobacteria bacterium]|nr:hypothetical protein [Pseudomonadota bacterium]
MDYKIKECEHRTHYTEKQMHLTDQKNDQNTQNMSLCQHSLQQHVAACQQTLQRHADALKADLVNAQTVADHTYQSINDRLFRLENRYAQSLQPLCTPTPEPISSKHPQPDNTQTVSNKADKKDGSESDEGDEGEESTDASQ